MFLKCFTTSACIMNVPQLCSASSITNIFAAHMRLSCFETKITNWSSCSCVTSVPSDHNSGSNITGCRQKGINCVYLTTMTILVCVCDLVFHSKKSTNTQLLYDSESSFFIPVYSQRYFLFINHIIHWAELRCMIWWLLVTAAYSPGLKQPRCSSKIIMLSSYH